MFQMAWNIWSTRGQAVLEQTHRPWTDSHPDPIGNFRRASRCAKWFTSSTAVTRGAEKYTSVMPQVSFHNRIEFPCMFIPFKFPESIELLLQPHAISLGPLTRPRFNCPRKSASSDSFSGRKPGGLGDVSHPYRCPHIIPRTRIRLQCYQRIDIIT